MVPTWLIAVFVVLREAWSARRDARIRFLLLQIELLRQKLPGNRVILSPEDRLRLLRLGAAMDHEVHDLIGIVSVKTYRRWRRDQEAGREPGRVGRRRVIPGSPRVLIIRLARENIGWGVRRIVGELRKLALTSRRSTVRRVLVGEGILPDPDRRAPKGVVTPWRTFVEMHANTMVACDFFCKAVWTPLGKRVAYVLVFIHLSSRRVFVSPSTYEPNETWMQQQARNTLIWLDDEKIDPQFVIHDRDSKFAASFNALFEAAGARIVRSPVQSPIANCFAESWIGTLKRECLNHFFCFSLRHVDHIVQTYTSYYNTFRPHQSLGNVPIGQETRPPPVGMVNPDVGPFLRRPYLAGLLNHYERRAA